MVLPYSQPATNKNKQQNAFEGGRDLAASRAKSLFQMTLNTKKPETTPEPTPASPSTSSQPDVGFDFDPISKIIGWRINYALPDLEERLTYGIEMIHQSIFLWRVMKQFEFMVSEVFVLENTPWNRFLPVDDGESWRRLLNDLGKTLRVGEKEEVRLNFELQRGVPDGDRRALLGSRLVAWLEYLEECIRIFEETVVETILPENSPFVVSVAKGDLTPRTRFLTNYGRALRIGDREDDLLHLDVLDPENSRKLMFYPLEYIPDPMREGWVKLQEILKDIDPHAATKRILEQPIFHTPIIPGAKKPTKKALKAEAKKAKDEQRALDAIIHAAASSSSSTKINLEGQSCDVCFTQCENTHILSKLPCGHIYHHACIDEWNDKHFGECPACLGVIPGVEDTPSIAPDCKICFLKCEFDNMLSELPCGHVYHYACFEKWSDDGHFGECPACLWIIPELDQQVTSVEDMMFLI